MTSIKKKRKKKDKIIQLPPRILLFNESSYFSSNYYYEYNPKKGKFSQTEKVSSEIYKKLFPLDQEKEIFLIVIDDKLYFKKGEVQTKVLEFTGGTNFINFIRLKSYQENCQIIIVSFGPYLYFLKWNNLKKKISVQQKEELNDFIHYLTYLSSDSFITIHAPSQVTQWEKTKNDQFKSFKAKLKIPGYVQPLSLGNRLLLIDKAQYCYEINKDGSYELKFQLPYISLKFIILDEFHFVLVNTKIQIMRHNKGKNLKKLQSLVLEEYVDIYPLTPRSFFLDLGNEFQIYRSPTGTKEPFFTKEEIIKIPSTPYHIRPFYLIPPSNSAKKKLVEIIEPFLPSLPLDLISSSVEFLSEYILPVQG